ncbi:MAG TPA: LAGLIDADG family homing endonuclease [Nocardioidaceae bacterium]|nr:LAGLIDADG family homing endonuclease [Nocardioidaceae bacterium]
MILLQPPVEIYLRGRGQRVLDADDFVLASRGGASPPRVTPADALRVGDFVGVEYGAEWAVASPPLPRQFERDLYGSEKQITIPDTMSAELAFLLGAYLSEGHTTRRTWTVVITNSVETVLERVQAAWFDIFGLQARITRQPGKCPGVVVSSKRLVQWLSQLGCGSRASDKAVPEVINWSTREEVLAFLQGAALDAYTTHANASSKWAICLESAQAISQLQDLLTRLGIVNSQIAKWNKKYLKHYHELYAAGPWGQDLCHLVPFLEPDKKARALDYCELTFQSRSRDVIPGITGPELRSLVPRGRNGRGGKGTGRQALNHLQDPRTRHVTRLSVQRAQQSGAQLPPWLEGVLLSGTRFVPIVDMRPT